MVSLNFLDFIGILLGLFILFPAWLYICVFMLMSAIHQATLYKYRKLVENEMKMRLIKDKS